MVCCWPSCGSAREERRDKEGLSWAWRQRGDLLSLKSPRLRWGGINFCSQKSGPPRYYLVAKKWSHRRTLLAAKTGPGDSFWLLPRTSFNSERDPFAFGTRDPLLTSMWNIAHAHTIACRNGTYNHLFPMLCERSNKKQPKTANNAKNTMYLLEAFCTTCLFI